MGSDTEGTADDRRKKRKKHRETKRGRSSGGRGQGKDKETEDKKKKKKGRRTKEKKRRSRSVSSSSSSFSPPEGGGRKRVATIISPPDADLPPPASPRWGGGGTPRELFSEVQPHLSQTPRGSEAMHTGSRWGSQHALPPPIPPVPVVAPDPDDFAARMPLQPPQAPLPPLPVPTNPAFLGQYVQSALTGDFKPVQHAPQPLRAEADAEATLRAGKAVGLAGCCYVKALLHTVDLTLSHLRGALLLLAAVLLLMVRGVEDHRLFVWYYRAFANPLQKVSNFLSYSALAASLIPLAVVSALEEHAAIMQLKREGVRPPPPPVPGEAAGCCAWAAVCLHSGRRVAWTPLRVYYAVQALIYAAILGCCIWTGAYDDVVLEHKEEVEREFRPRPPTVSGRVGELQGGRYAEVHLPGAAPLSSCEPYLDGLEVNADNCQGRGCCWQEDESSCLVPEPKPAAVLVTEMEGYYFSYAYAAEECSRLNMQLCTTEELCPNGVLSPDVSAQLSQDASSVIPSGSQWHLFISAYDCSVIRTVPTATVTDDHQAFCCRGCPQHFSYVEDLTSLAGRTRSLNTVCLVWVVLAAAGYLWGLLREVGNSEQPPPTEPGTNGDGTENEDDNYNRPAGSQIGPRLPSLSRLQHIINERRTTS